MNFRRAFLTALLALLVARADAVTLNNQLLGWYHGAGLGIQRWGTNNVASIVSNGPDNDLLYATFDANVSSTEAHLSGGDSGGATFIKDGAIWKLAGINFAIDGPFYTDATGANPFQAALFDARGFYYSDGHQPPTYFLIDSTAPVPSGFYPTRISTKTGWLLSVTDPLGDPDSDGIPNLLEYGAHADPAAPDIAQSPQVAREGDALTLTYRQAIKATDITYTVEESNDLTSWQPAAATQQVIASNSVVRIVKASVPINGATQLFLRLRVTRP